MWTVYDHPSDFPDHFIARRWEVAGGADPVPTSQVITATDIEALRGMLTAMGLYPLNRNEGDDPTIMESWL